MSSAEWKKKNYNRKIRVSEATVAQLRKGSKAENIAKAKGTDKLTAEELNNAIRGAREDARKTVEQTLFTIVRRTRASSSQVMQLLFPFYAAYENTAKRWAGIVAENPQAVAIKRYLFEILKERYGKNEKFIDRLASNITTKEDYESLGAFITDIYEIGFLKAVKEYKEQFEKMGMRVNVVAEEKPKDPGHRIFD